MKKWKEITTDHFFLLCFFEVTVHGDNISSPSTIKLMLSLQKGFFLKKPYLKFCGEQFWGKIRNLLSVTGPGSIFALFWVLFCFFFNCEIFFVQTFSYSCNLNLLPFIRVISLQPLLLCQMYCILKYVNVYCFRS